ncbi:SMP-30/gluconolactonase/LRE family protein [Microbulbifer halophilus]|uniref:SMP-30/gluconolactonase/LRE family protein n=1 Tax=Microbulbifer halophilus TaxID=453963 RepID=A0ABW5E8G9_9GAMM|nr:SMP-30/gluconolactonase/LRE family protein [Microbulbifer halophilus]MCW8125418.1 SMP-30/gluconolactonase/LRE family protein [Microbulbifer halophilus]
MLDRLPIIWLGLVLCTCGVSTAAAVVSEGAKLRLISEDFSFTEGPAADPAGNVFFTDQPNNNIWKYGTDGTLSLFMDDAGRANGLYFDDTGNLLACADDKGELWQITPDGKVTVLLDNFDSRRLNGPNDLWVNPHGGIYFTDPFYPRDYWDRDKKEIETEAVYYLAPGAGQATRVAGDLQKPNGLIGSADGKRLYIADIGADKTYAYAIDSDGGLSGKTLFAEMGSDGMTLDSGGNLYLTGEGVTVFDPQGEKIEHIDVPEDWTANVTFGGEARRTLFITAMDSLYSLEMRVDGP